MAEVWERIVSWFRALLGRGNAEAPSLVPTTPGTDAPRDTIPPLPASLQAETRDAEAVADRRELLEADLNTDDRMDLPENPMESVSIDALLRRARTLREPSDWETAHNAPASSASEVRHSLELLLHSLEQGASSRVDRRFYQRLALVTRSRDPKLPPYPRVASELARLVDDPKVQVRSLVKLIERDPALIRAVWLQASSAAHAQPPRSLAAAVARLGTDSLWRIAMSTVLRATAVQVEGFEDEVAYIQEHGFIAADVAVFITGDRRGPPFLAGLLNSVGKLVIYNAAKADRNGDRPSRAVVERMISQHHASFGMLVGAAWKLDESVIQAIGHHHGSSRFPAGVDKELCAAVARACLVGECILQIANDESPTSVSALAAQCSGADEVQSLLSVAGLAWSIFHLGQGGAPGVGSGGGRPRPSGPAAPSTEADSAPVGTRAGADRPKRGSSESNDGKKRRDEEPRRRKKRRSEGGSTRRRSESDRDRERRRRSASRRDGASPRRRRRSRDRSDADASDA